MPNSYKIAGQAAPLADTDTTLYTVPTGKSFVGSTLSICNRDTSGANASFRVAVVKSGETIGNSHYLCYEKLIESRGDRKLTIGLALSEGDFVVVRASSASLSFSLFGSEIS
jgi:hypothetical protein